MTTSLFYTLLLQLFLLQLSSAGQIRYSASNLKISKLVATGSYGCVYGGNLNDTQLAVKVPHRGIGNAFYCELRALQMVADLISDSGRRFLMLPWPHLPTMFLVSIPEELQFCVKRLPDNSFEVVESGPRKRPACAFPLSQFDLEAVLDPEDSPASGIVFTERDMVSIAIDIARGLQVLKNAGLVHLDMKPQNVLLNTDVDPTEDCEFPPVARAVLCDFGFMEKVDQVIGYAGTPGYMGPEFFRDSSRRSMRKRLNSTAAMDMFAFGSMLMQLWPPTQMSLDELETMQDKSWQEPDGFLGESPHLFRTLARRCWRKNPSDRPTPEEIIDELVLYQKKLTQQLKSDFGWRTYIKSLFSKC